MLTSLLTHSPLSHYTPTIPHYTPLYPHYTPTTPPLYPHYTLTTQAELERAFRSGATYAIYWKPDYAKGVYGLGASYETSAQALSDESCTTKTYVNECRDFKPSIESDGPIGIAGSSGVSIKVVD